MSRETEGRCGAAFVTPWKARVAGVSREGGGLGMESRGMQECGLVGPVASRLAVYAFGVTLKVWTVVAGLALAFGNMRLTGRLAARLWCVCPSRKCVCRALIWTANLAGTHRSGRGGVFPRRLCVGGVAGDVLWRRSALGETMLLITRTPVRSPNALQWCRVRTRPGEAQRY